MIRIRETTRVNIIYDHEDKDRIILSLESYKLKGFDVSDKAESESKGEQGYFELRREVLIDEFKSE